MSLASALEKPPEGVPVEVAPGIAVLRMPMPFALDHINVYLLEDTDGWIVIDTGLDWPKSKAIWQEVLASVFKRKPLKSIIVTHLHPDHIGMAAWLQETTGAPVSMTAGELAQAEALWELTEQPLERTGQHYHRFGMDKELQARMFERGPVYRRLVKHLPKNVTILGQDDVLEVQGRGWQVRIGRGHSPEHACLWSAQDRILVSGDHVLPNITPNISYLPVGSENPLNDYLLSLSDFQGMDCRMALPAHGLPFMDIDARIRSLRDHHNRLLTQIEAYCDEPRNVLDCTRHLFGQDLPDHQMGFATGEAAAHLVYLVSQGRLNIEEDDIWHFRRVD